MQTVAVSSDQLSTQTDSLEWMQHGSSQTNGSEWCFVIGTQTDPSLWLHAQATQTDASVESYAISTQTDIKQLSSAAAQTKEKRINQTFADVSVETQANIATQVIIYCLFYYLYDIGALMSH